MPGVSRDFPSCSPVPAGNPTRFFPVKGLCTPDESAAFIVDAFYNGGEERDVASFSNPKIR